MRRLFLLGLAFWLLAAEAFAGPNDPKPLRGFDYKFRRGGSFSIGSGLLIPAGPLSRTLNNTLGYDLNFDIGVSPDISVVFGVGYYETGGRQNEDYRLMMAPAWFGIKSKNQFLPAAEVFWEAAAALYYEKAYMVRSSVGNAETLDGGGFLGTGFDIWWTRWLMSGFEVKVHLVSEGDQIYPFTQLGLRVGIRG